MTETVSDVKTIFFKFFFVFCVCLFLMGLVWFAIHKQKNAHYEFALRMPRDVLIIPVCFVCCCFFVFFFFFFWKIIYLFSLFCLFFFCTQSDARRVRLQLRRCNIGKVNMHHERAYNAFQSDYPCESSVEWHFFALVMIIVCVCVCVCVNWWVLDSS